MAAQRDTLALETRSDSGTTAARAVRHAGKVPAILYGHGAKPLSVAIDARTFDELLHGGGRSRLVNLTIDGKGKDTTAVIREIQRDPVSRRVIHADLQRVSATETISVSLPLVTIGVADGVRNFGAVMDVVVHMIEVSGPANELPERFEVDVTELGVHDHVTAADVKLPPKFKLDMDPATLLISIEPSRTEQQLAEAEVAAAAPAEPTEVPTVGETAAATEGEESAS